MRGVVMREALEGIRRIEQEIWRTLVKVGRGVSNHLEMNARVTLERNRIREEEENEWEREIEGSQEVRVRVNQALRRISTEDSRDYLTVTTWDLDEKGRNGGTREGSIREIMKEDGWEIEASRREDAQTWRKVDLSSNQPRRNHGRIKMNLLREGTARAGEITDVLTVKRVRD